MWEQLSRHSLLDSKKKIVETEEMLKPVVSYIVRAGNVPVDIDTIDTNAYCNYPDTTAPDDRGHHIIPST